MKISDPQLDAAREMLAALRDACASIELQAATAEQYAKSRDHSANTALAAELRRNCRVYRTAIAVAEVAGITAKD